jgi:hypothetical protein
MLYIKELIFNNSLEIIPVKVIGIYIAFSRRESQAMEGYPNQPILRYLQKLAIQSSFLP